MRKTSRYGEFLPINPAIRDVYGMTMLVFATLSDEWPDIALK